MWVGNGRGGIYRVGYVRASIVLDHTHIDLNFDRELCGIDCT